MICYLHDFHLSWNAVFHGNIHTVAQSHVVDEAVQQSVLKQTLPLLLHRLLQLRDQVPVDLQLTEQGQQPQQAGLRGLGARPRAV